MRFLTISQRSAIALMAVLALSSAGLPIAPIEAARAADSVPVSFALPDPSELEADTRLTTDDVPAPVSGTLDLGLVQDAAEALLGSMPAEEWDLAALSWSFAGDAEAAFAFVRDRIGYEPYPGVLRGAKGTLAARAGNAYDRAILLKALLDAMLVPTRFAFGQLDEATAGEVLARTFVAPSDPLPNVDMAGAAVIDAPAMSNRARRDYALLREALGQRLDSVTAAPAAGAATDPQHHVWVQVLLGADWVDFDPTLPEAQPGDTLTPIVSTAAEIPAAERQSVRLELVAETLTSGRLERHDVLDKTLDVAESSDSEIFLYFQPAIGGIGGSIAQALGEATGYLPELMIDGVVTQGSSFPVLGGTDIFTGEALGTSGDETTLASLRLVATRQAPGYPADAFVRTLIDRALPSDRTTGDVSFDRLTPLQIGPAGPVDLLPLHHLMISSGSANARSLVLQRAQVARFVDLHLLDPDEADGYALSDLLWPVAVADAGLVLASERTIVHGLGVPGSVGAYVARPRIFIASLAPTGVGEGGIAYETDLLADDLRIIGPGGQAVGDATDRHIWYGAAEAALETEFALATARGLDPATRTVTAVSLAMGSPLTVVAAHDQNAIGGSAQALQEAVAGGLIAVVPGPADAAEAWWTVDPSDGQTRSILDPGLGAGRGIGNNYVNESKGATHYVDDKGNSLVRKAAGPPSRCGGGQEYVVVIGCVSTPVAWTIYGVGAVILIAVAYGASKWLQSKL